MFQLVSLNFTPVQNQPGGYLMTTIPNNLTRQNEVLAYTLNRELERIGALSEAGEGVAVTIIPADFTQLLVYDEQESETISIQEAEAWLDALQQLTSHKPDKYGFELAWQTLGQVVRRKRS